MRLGTSISGESNGCRSERDLGVSAAAPRESAVPAKGKNCPGWHQTQHHQIVKRADCPTVPSTCSASPWVPCKGLGPMIWEGLSRSLNMSEGGQQGWWKGWKECSVRKVWGLQVCQTWRKGCERQPHCSLKLPGEGSGEGSAELFSLVSSNRTCGNSLKLYQEKFRLRRWSKTGTGLCERLSMLHACHSLRGFWTMPLSAFTFLPPWTG